MKEEPRDNTLVAPLLRALQRLTKDGRLTSRDGRLALLEAIERHATPDDTTPLRAWLRGLERRRADAIKLVGERTYRVWKLYMSAGAYGFRTGGINIVQTLLSKPTPEGRAGVPMTREDLYQREKGKGGGKN